jgi:hypothetical protein
MVHRYYGQTPKHACLTKPNRLYLMYKGCPIYKAPLDIKTKQE